MKILAMKLLAAGCVCAVIWPAPLCAQQASPPVPPVTGPASATASGAPLPADYVIGPEDVLTILFWRDKDLSADAVVRPDGKITLPLLNDLQAAGLTPEQLKDAVEEAASKYVADPTATVIVKEIRSRKVYVLGQVLKPGTVPLASEMTVLQLIAEVGGLQEYANKRDITIIRSENGRERRFKFNYNEVVQGRRLEQNILLKPGDTVVVR
jgi:polysaccharide biosynthesis/export protein